MRYPRRGFAPGCATKSWCVLPRKGSRTRTETLSREWWPMNDEPLTRSSHQRWVSDVSGASGNEFFFGFSSGDEISWWRTTERGWGGCAAARGTDFSPVAGCETKVVGAEGGSTA